jgi:hypothetical protein
VKLLKGKRLKPVGPSCVQRYPLSMAVSGVVNSTQGGLRRWTVVHS